MSQTRDCTIVLELNDIQDFFVAPALNPLSSNELELLGQPGILRLLHRLEPRSLGKKMRLVLLLPPDKIDPYLKVALRQGLERFCVLKIQDNQNKLELLRRIWWRTAVNGVLFLATCFLLAGVLSSSPWGDFLPPFIRSVVVEGLTIVGSVSLWHPAETLLYDWIPIARENDIYRLLQAIEVDLLPQSFIQTGSRLADE